MPVFTDPLESMALEPVDAKPVPDEKRVYDATFNNWHVFPAYYTDVQQREAIANFNRRAAKQNMIAQALGIGTQLAAQLTQPQAPRVPNAALGYAMGPQGVRNFLDMRQQEREKAADITLDQQRLEQDAARDALQARHDERQLQQSALDRTEARKEREAYHDALLAQNKGGFDYVGQDGQTHRRYANGFDEIIPGKTSGIINSENAGRRIDETRRRNIVTEGQGQQRIGIAQDMTKIKAILAKNGLQVSDADLPVLQGMIERGESIPVRRQDGTVQQMRIDYDPNSGDDFSLFSGSPQSPVIPGAADTVTGNAPAIPGAQPPDPKVLQQQQKTAKIQGEGSLVQQKQAIANKRATAQDLRDELKDARADRDGFQDDIDKYEARIQKAKAAAETTQTPYVEDPEITKELANLRAQRGVAAQRVNELTAQLHPKHATVIPGATPSEEPAPVPTAQGQPKSKYPEGTKATIKGVPVIMRGGQWQRQ